MDVRDLRIDDTVLYNNKKYRIERIEKVDTEEIMIRNEYERQWSKVINLQPIPITDELLEKIGFKKSIRVKRSRSCGFFSNIGNILIWHEYEKGKYIIRIVSNKLSVVLTIKYISYLHQLQHELYDAGIDIKIELE